MKNYTITVNGNVYNVTVEEGTTAGAAPVVSAAKAAPAPKAAPAAPKAAAPAGAAGSVEVLLLYLVKSAKSKQQQAPL